MRLERAQVVVDLLARRRTRVANVAAEAGSASSERIWLLMGSTATVAAAGSSMTSRSSMAALEH